MCIFHGIYLRSYSDLKRGSLYHTLTGKLWDAYLVYSIHYIQASKFQIECTCPSGKWIVKITCPRERERLSLSAFLRTEECTIQLSKIYKANVTYVKIRNMQLSIGQVLQVFHLSDCHFYSSQTIGRVKFRTLHRILNIQQDPISHTHRQAMECLFCVLWRKSIMS